MGPRLLTNEWSLAHPFPCQIDKSLTTFNELMKRVAAMALACDDSNMPVAKAFRTLTSSMGLEPLQRQLLDLWLWDVECWMGANLEVLQLIEFAVDGLWG